MVAEQGWVYNRNNRGLVINVASAISSEVNSLCDPEIAANQ
jgi:hypothetical protein